MKRSRPAKPARTPKEDRPAVVEELCLLIERGESLRKASEQIGRDPATMLRWIEEDEALTKQYARARDAGLHVMAQQIVEISDEQEILAVYQGESVRLDLSATAVARNRLRVDARKWLLSKMMPKTYGDKLAIGGADDLPAIQSMDDSRLLARAAEILASAKGEGSAK